MPFLTGPLQFDLFYSFFICLVHRTIQEVALKEVGMIPAVATRRAPCSPDLEWEAKGKEEEEAAKIIKGAEFLVD